MPEILNLKVRAGNFWKPLRLVILGQRIECHFSYNKVLIDEIKNMEGARWHGFDEQNPRKIWTIKNSPRNWFNLEYLVGKNPYAHYEKPFIEFDSLRPLYPHQKKMTAHILTVNSGIWAAEMGLGKTLSMIEVMEYACNSGFLKSNEEAWYIGPKAGVRAVGREYLKWDSKIRSKMFSYEGLVKHLKDFSDIRPIPKIVCFDESSKIKNPNSQRSQAALYIANKIREIYGRDGYIIEMSGTPAPKDPTDWWHQCEVACPGFLKEGSIAAFKKRLCIIEQRESLITGGVYPHVVTWLDDENKCAVCGQTRFSDVHWDDNGVFGGESGCHKFVKSVNEVGKLYERMQGLVIVLFKKDNLSLPDKIYEIIRLEPNIELLQAAKLVKKMATRTVEALSLLRELSDGFQYKQVKTGEEECPICHGKKTCLQPIGGEETEPWTQETAKSLPPENTDIKYEELPCMNCGATGSIPVYEREIYEIGSLKDQVFIEELEAVEDWGRYVVWGGFLATVDRLVAIAHRHGWATLRVDGRGYLAQDADGNVLDADLLLSAMDRSHKDFENLRETFPKICFVGNPEAGGMALTLTASNVELFYSNSFKGEARIQSEDRCHRIGMGDGLIIRDLFLLPADEYVYNNLKKKRELQAISLGEFKTALSELESTYEKGG
jgi:hypothetical protein